MKTSNHNDSVKLAHVRVVENNDSKVANLEAATAVKLQNAAEARQTLITEKVRATNLAATHTSGVSNSSLRSSCSWQVMSVGQQTRNKQERGKLALASKAEKAVRIQTEVDEKIEKATANKNAILKEKVRAVRIPSTSFTKRPPLTPST